MIRTIIRHLILAKKQQSFFMIELHNLCNVKMWFGKSEKKKGLQKLRKSIGVVCIYVFLCLRKKCNG